MLDRWDRVFGALEDRISVGESGRAAGDKPYFELLKDTKSSSRFRLEWAKESKEWEMWLAISVGCQVRAHSDALGGSYGSYDSECKNQLHEGLPPGAAERFKAAVPVKVVPPVKAFETPGQASSSLSKDKTASQREAEARSWHTQGYCEKDGFVWKDGVCHAQKLGSRFVIGMRNRAPEVAILQLQKVPHQFLSCVR